MADLGFYSLRLGLFLCLVGMGAGIYAGLSRRAEWTVISERSVYLVCGATSFAMLALFWALATNDFSLSYVAQHSARTMPLHYRLGALWGGQAGSLLLEWLAERQVPGRVVLTKTDKLKLMKRKERIRILTREIGEGFGKPIITSSQKGEGLDVVWRTCFEHAAARREPAPESEPSSETAEEQGA